MLEMTAKTLIVNVRLHHARKGTFHLFCSRATHSTAAAFTNKCVRRCQKLMYDRGVLLYCVCSDTEGYARYLMASDGVLRFTITRGIERESIFLE
jgi:hypothetical protein